MPREYRVLPIKNLSDAQREIERLAKEINLLLALPVTGAGAPPTGPAGGVLGGSFPDPSFAVDMATQSELNAAIAAIPPVDLSPYRTSAAEDVINAAEAATRAAADTTEATTRAAADTAEATARASADTAESTARASADTAEATARASGDATVQAFAIQRANHTGTQLAATISDFNSAARAQTEAEIVAGSNITITPSGAGPTRQLLIAAAGGGGGGSALAYCSVKRAAAINPLSGNGYFSFDTEVFDSSGMHDLATNPSRVNILVTGRYVITAQWANAVLTNMYANINIRKSGTTILRDSGVSYNGTGGVQIQLAWVGDLVAGDYIECGWSVGGSTQTVANGPQMEVAQIASSGGGTAMGQVWDHLVPDGSPHALTDEFATNSLSGYTTIYGTGDGATILDIHTTKPGALYIQAPQIQYHQHSILKPLPAGDFSIFTAARMASPGNNLDSTWGGIILSTAAVAGSGAQVGAVIGRSTTGAGIQIAGLLAWNGFGSSASGASLTQSNYCEWPEVVIRMQRNGTTCTRSFSSDGETWLGTQTFTNAAWTHFGLFGQNYMAAAYAAAFSFEYLRYYPNATQMNTGGLRTIYG